MDEKLVAWARAVKSRRRHMPGAPPPLWLFTDPAAMPDLLATIARLPKGLCGVVFRHDNHPGRIALARQVAKLCRNRRLPLTIAGTHIPLATLNKTIGRHLRAPARLTTPRHTSACTASAHSKPDLRRAEGLGATPFLSPAFPTKSHPGATALGPIRWAALARTHRTACALGGIDGRTARRLPRWTAGAGAIGALAP